MNIPEIKLNNGNYIPAIGNGPMIMGYGMNRRNSILPGFISRRYEKYIGNYFLSKSYIDGVVNSLKNGFRLIDYSAGYGDGHLIGEAIRKSGIARNELFLTTRIPNSVQFQGAEEAIRSYLDRQLKGFNTNYVDVLMFHWPVPGHFVDTYKVMEKLVREGLCKNIGVANCNIHHIDFLLSNVSIKPAINQFEVHPLFTQKPLIDYCKKNDIQVESYTPIGRNDDRIMRLPLLKKIGMKYNKTIIQVVLRWHVQLGLIPIVRTLNDKHQRDNLSIFDFELTESEMNDIDSVNINSRLRYDPDNCDFTIV